MKPGRSHFGAVLICFVLSSCLVPILAPSAAAQTSEGGQTLQISEQVEEQANLLFSEVLSPYCPGLLLRDCPSSDAAALKERLKAQLSAGKSVAGLARELEIEFGDKVKAAPDMSGLGWLAWGAPLAFLLLGGALLVFWARGSTTARNQLR